MDIFTYDHMGRLLIQKQKINNQAEEIIADHVYDELGQLASKAVGNTKASPLQKIDYTYNVRGWLKQINDPHKMGDDLFGFKINYNNPEKGARALYNGNISETHWKTANDGQLRNYKYNYDGLNRITGAVSGDNRYNLTNVTYDKMGNIESLSRGGFENGFGQIDKLAYQYDTGNKLLSVTDTASLATGGFKDGNKSGNDYDYDANGNLTVDKNKGVLSVTYNHLNLPTQISGRDTANYVYDALGNKIEKKAGSYGSTYQYAGNFVYRKSTRGGVFLEYLFTPEGYIEPNDDGTFQYVYQYKDHLDNIRLSYSDDDKDGKVTTTEIREEKNYYPFGLVQKGYNNVIKGRKHSYGYGGKEENDELGLETLDFGARNYDPAIGRWMNLDPMAELMTRHSPYNYAFNNPILFVDPDGMVPYLNGELDKMIGWEEQKLKSEPVFDIYITGDSGFVNTAFANLQSLSDDKLQIDDNGKVTITESSCNSGCNEGTSLVADLIESDKVVTIKESTPDSKAKGSNVTFFDNGFASIKKDGSPNKGSGSTIFFNPSKETGGRDVNNSKKRPSEVGLGHELFHATDGIKGIDDRTILTSNPRVVDPDQEGGGLVLQRFEFNARISENKLRKERNVPLRQTNFLNKKN